MVVKEFRLWNEARSKAQLTFNAFQPLFHGTPNLAMYYKVSQNYYTLYNVVNLDDQISFIGEGGVSYSLVDEPFWMDCPAGMTGSFIGCTPA